MHADQMQLFVPHQQIVGPEIEGYTAGRETPEQRVVDQNIVDNENRNGMGTSTSLLPRTIGENQGRRYPSRPPDQFFMTTSK